MCCRSDTFIDVTGVETASSFSGNTSYKTVDDTVVIDNVSDISDTAKTCGGDQVMWSRV